MQAYERLLEYAKFPTASDQASASCPSTPSQLEFAAYLAKEMTSLGIADVQIDENGYLFGSIPANIPHWDGAVLGLIAHMDVSYDAPCEHVCPRVVRNYDGGSILLNGEKGLRLDPADYPQLLEYKGCDLVVTDGTTLLGADDKAGIAEILTMAEYLQQHPELPHGEIKIGFTPDEEIGRGAHRFDVERFGADFAYTLDGAAFGEVEYENFNAASAKILITGYSIHPGTAKDKMKNASTIATEFHQMLPAQERPEHTEGYQGFYHLTDLMGTVANAHMTYYLRDHDAAKLEQRKAVIQQTAAKLNTKYGPNTVTVEIADSYRNMAEKIRPHWHLIETAQKAIEAVGGHVISQPIRGGTDGSQLSFMGLPCPNLGTGSHNHHGVMEYACIQAMDQCVQALIEIVKDYGQMKLACQ